jgi:zinc transport system ATP-binding protein
MKILEVKNLNVAFDDLRVIENLNFEVEKGDNLTIIGPNGSGKTVLFKALLNLIPASGTIKWSPGVKIGYIPQRLEIDRSLPLTLGEFLQTKIKIFKPPAGEVARLLDLTKLPRELLRRPIGKLSSGQFQRALIAFALIGDPNVLLFDEPTASVDAPGEEQIYETLHRLQDEKDLTLILVSHELSLVYRYATKVLCLNKQQICFGIPEEVLSPEILEKLYGAPHKFYHHLHDAPFR